MDAMRLILVYFVTVSNIDNVESYCQPSSTSAYTSTIERDDSRTDFDCIYSSKTPCESSQSFIYYKCDTYGNNCSMIFVYTVGNNSESTFGNTRLGGYLKSFYYELFLYRANVADEGFWKCVITFDGVEYRGRTWNVTIVVKPKKDEIRLTPLKQKVIAYKKVNFTCEVHNVRPTYVMVLKIDGDTFRHGVGVNISTGHTWTIRNTFEVAFSPAYPMEAYCITERYYGSSHQSVQSNRFIINPVLENPLKLGPSDEVQIECIMSTDFSVSGWSKNGDFLQLGGKFKETHVDVKGQFDLINPNITTARLSVLSWTMPGLEQGCTALDNNAGSYECSGDHEVLGYSYTSKPRRISVAYPPTVEPNIAVNKIITTTKGADTLLLCPLCAFPAIMKYHWFKDGVEFGNRRTLLLAGMAKYDFGEYTCVATNSYGSANASISVNKIDGLPLTGEEKILVATTGVIAGFAVAAVVMLALIVTFIVLCITVIRKRQPKGQGNNGKSSQHVEVGPSNHSEREKPAYANTS